MADVLIIFVKREETVAFDATRLDTFNEDVFSEVVVRIFVLTN